ncbi:MAG: hypothetical protein WCK63_00060 [Betaproteobacteria bacterium]
MSLLGCFFILAFVEVVLILTIKLQRRSFQWLITERDELPLFDTQALKKFFDYSFDPQLGWVRRANSSGIEHGDNGPVEFHIDATGARLNPIPATPATMVVFGDSYAFCRQVADDQTWEAQLSRQEGFGVLNFGVGNYGVDQALLRYEGLVLPDTVNIAVMCFVPETICRIQSYWKHYLEFGNTFAFKPRFVLNDKQELLLLENPVRCPEDFASIQEKLPAIRKADAFYATKFRSLQFRFPYLLSLLRNPWKQSQLIAAVATRALLRSFRMNSRLFENLPFTLIMKNNVRDAHRLYKDANSTQLLDAIMIRFAEEARRRGHTPLVMVIPQFFDIQLSRNGLTPYQEYFIKLSSKMSVIDLTEPLLASASRNNYINDQFGGHLSAEGNRLVAETVSSWLKTTTKANI